MGRFRDAIPPSERVEWRLPEPWKAADALGWLAFYGVGAAAGWAVWADVIEDKVWSGAALTLASTAGVGGLGKTFRLLGALLWGRRTVIVTGQRIVLATGRMLGRTQTVYRDAISSASLYEGDQTLVLHGRDAELLRLSGLEKEKAAELLAQLDVPTAVWSKRKPSQPVRAARRKALAATLAFWAALAGAVVALAGPGTIADMAASGFEYLSGTITAPGAIVAALTGGGASLFALAVAQAMLHDYAAVAIARYRATPEVLRELICAAGDPLWRGWPRDPKKAAKVSDIVESLNGWAKYLGALPVEPIQLEPEYRDFRAEAAAAEET